MRGEVFVPIVRYIQNPMRSPCTSTLLKQKVIRRNHEKMSQEQD